LDPAHTPAPTAPKVPPTPACRRVVAEVLHMEDLGPGGPQMLADLKAVAHKIKAVGDALPVR